MTPAQRYNRKNRELINARQRARDRAKATGRKAPETKIGLAEMRARSKPGECPFCGDPIPPREQQVGRRALTHCGDEVCASAYHRYWRRDQRFKQLNRADQRSESNKTYHEKMRADPERWAARLETHAANRREKRRERREQEGT